MIDSNVFDKLTAEGVREVVEEATSRGLLDLVTTHVQHDEVGRGADGRQRADRQRLTVTVIPTTGMAWGVSRWDMATWPDDAATATLQAVGQGNPNHAEDALILSTAQHHGLALVTEDRRLRSRALDAGVSVLHAADLIAAVIERLAADPRRPVTPPNNAANPLPTGSQATEERPSDPPENRS